MFSVKCEKTMKKWCHIWIYTKVPHLNHMTRHWMEWIKRSKIVFVIVKVMKTDIVFWKIKSKKISSILIQMFTVIKYFDMSWIHRVYNILILLSYFIRFAFCNFFILQHLLITKTTILRILSNRLQENFTSIMVLIT